MQYGLDTAAIGAFQAMPGFLKVFGYVDEDSSFGYGIDGTFQRLISSLLTLGSLLSSLSAGIFSDYLGRKPALWTACILNAVACFIQIFATQKGVLYLGRLLIGFANGFFVTFSNVYASEVAPTQIRGLAVALFAYWVNMGSIIGAIVVNSTTIRGDKLSYQVPLACLLIVPMFLAVSLFFVPESPRWLLQQGKTIEAKEALRKLRGESMVTEEEWHDIRHGALKENQDAKGVGILDMFRGNDLGRTLRCFGAIACQAGSGFWFFIAYQTYFFAIAGIEKSFQFSIMNSCIGFMGVNAGMVAMQACLGRRTILMLAWSVDPVSRTTGEVVVGLTALFYFFYNGCVGTASYPVATELVSTRLRAWTVGSATSLGYLLAWLIGFCSPYFVNPAELNWGAKYCYFWAASNVASLLFVYFFIPETKGKSLEDINKIFDGQMSSISGGVQYESKC
ncbi:hypothetical protein Q7P37_007616 [Cladosporium fusiforme]